MSRKLPQARLNISDHALVAKMIKSELSGKFPGIEFSIKSKAFMSGDNVTVDWKDGPTTDAIESLVGKYRYGNFDASKNLYLHNNRNNAIPQAQYVMTSHRYSESLLRNAKAEIALRFHVDMNNAQNVFAELGNFPQTLIRAKLERRFPF